MRVRKKPGKYRILRLANTKSIYTISLIIVMTISAGFLYKIFHLQPADNWFESKVREVGKIKLPMDDAPHQSQIEWWYYNGHLSSESGKQFSFHSAVFLVNSMTNHMISHVSFSDHLTGKYYTDQHRISRNPSINTENRFEFNLDGWSLTGGNGKDRLTDSSQDFGFDLELSSTQPPVFHGDDGIISLGTVGSSYYYSRTRMAVTGTIRIANTTEKVTGISWFDHQWGDFSIGQLSWDWFSLQLNNNIDVMIYQLRDKSKHPVLYMASVTQNGNTEWLQDTEFTLVPGKKWYSDTSGANYPIEWKISIPKKNIEITTKSILKNSEFNARLTTYNVYWEGPIKIQGSHSGNGFMELSGYSAER